MIKKISFYKAGTDSNLLSLKSIDVNRRFYQSLKVFAKNSSKLIDKFNTNKAHFSVIKDGGLLFAKDIIPLIKTQPVRVSGNLVVIDDILVTGKTLKLALNKIVSGEEYKSITITSLTVVIPIITKSIFFGSDFFPWLIKTFPEASIKIIFGVYEKNYYHYKEKITPGKLIHGKPDIGDFGDFYRLEQRSETGTFVTKFINVLSRHFYFSRWSKIRII